MLSNQIKCQEIIHNQVRFGQVLVGACFESHVWVEGMESFSFSPHFSFLILFSFFSTSMPLFLSNRTWMGLLTFYYTPFWETLFHGTCMWRPKFSNDSNSFNGTKLDRTQNNQGSMNVQILFFICGTGEMGSELESKMEPSFYFANKTLNSCGRFL